MARALAAFGILIVVALLSWSIFNGREQSRSRTLTNRPPSRGLVARWLGSLTEERDVGRTRACTGYDRPGRLASRATKAGAGSPGATGARTGRPAAAELRRIKRRVELLRGKNFDERIKVRFLARQDFVYRYADPLLGAGAAGYFTVEQRLLSTLGAMFSSVDLQRISHRATSEGLAGLYLPGTGRLLVRTGRSGVLSGYEKVVLAHELNHALEDQVIGLTSDPARGDDAQLAWRATVEGSATLLMHRYAARFLPAPAQVRVLRSPRRSHHPTADLHRLPHYLQKATSFPYVDGLRFVCRLYVRGGWPAVDRALRDPPESTAQLLFPDRYLGNEAPASAPDPGSLSRPWIKVAERDLGAAHLLWLFGAPSGDTSRALDHALRRAAAWRGGELAVWFRGRQTAIGLSLLQRDGAPSLCDSMRKWYRASFPTTKSAPKSGTEVLAERGRVHDAIMTCGEGRVRLGIAPHLDLARQLASL